MYVCKIACMYVMYSGVYKRFMCAFFTMHVCASMRAHNKKTCIHICTSHMHLVQSVLVQTWRQSCVCVHSPSFLYALLFFHFSYLTKDIALMLMARACWERQTDGPCESEWSTHECLQFLQVRVCGISRPRKFETKTSMKRQNKILDMNCSCEITCASRAALMWTRVILRWIPWLSWLNIWITKAALLVRAFVHLHLSVASQELTLKCALQKFMAPPKASCPWRPFSSFVSPHFKSWNMPKLEELECSRVEAGPCMKSFYSVRGKDRSPGLRS